MLLKGIIISLGILMLMVLLMFVYSFCVSANREDEYLDEYFKNKN